MPTVRRKTVDGRTYKLRKAKTERSGSRFEYYVTEDGNPIDDPVYSRGAGDRQFKETIQAVKRAAESNQDGGMGFDLGFGMGGGGGGPTIPGFGMESDDDDDDGPNIPGF